MIYNKNFSHLLYTTLLIANHILQLSTKTTTHFILNNFFLFLRYLTECYDELGTQYKVPIYCLSYPINIVKEENGRDSPAEFSEPVDGGTEIFLKLRISSTMSDVKLPVYSKDTVGQCKKKLQVSSQICPEITTHVSICKFGILFPILLRLWKVLMHVANVGFTAVNCWAIRCPLRSATYKTVMWYKSL